MKPATPPPQPPQPLQPPQPPHRGLLVANLLGQLALGLLAMTICIPSMQEWGQLLNATQAQVQLTFSAYVVAYGGLQLLWGPLSDHHGRRPVLLAGLALAVAGSVAAALAPAWPTLVAARALQGAGTAAGMVIGRAMVQDLFAGPERTRMMAWVGMAMGLCPPLATVLGGQLHVAVGWRSNFWLIALLAALLAVAAWRGLPNPGRRAAADAAAAADVVQRVHWLRSMGRAYAALARTPDFGWHVAVLAFTTGSFYIFLAGAPLVLGDYGVGPGRIGFHIMCIPLAYIVGNYATARWIRRLGEPRMMRIGQAAALAGISLTLALGLGGAHSALAFTLPLVLLGLGHGLLMPPALAGTVGLVPALAGAAAAVAGVLQQLLGALGAYLVGLSTHTNAVSLSALMLGFALVATLAQWRLHGRAPAHG